jgi:hypothetical protein
MAGGGGSVRLRSMAGGACADISSHRENSAILASQRSDSKLRLQQAHVASNEKPIERAGRVSIEAEA